MSRKAAGTPAPEAPPAKPRGPREGTIAAEHLAAAMGYYQAAIQVQMHYNEMLIRVRSFGLTAAATLLAVAGGASAGNGVEAAADRLVALPGGGAMHVSGVFAACALLLCVGLFVLDRLYYYRLFIAAVKNAVAWEIDNRAALQAIGVRRNPMTIHFVLTVPQAWSELCVIAFWVLPMVISAAFMVAAVV